MLPTANFDCNPGADLRNRSLDESERNPTAEGGRFGPASDDADRSPRLHDSIAVARRRRRVCHQETNEPPTQSFGLLPHQRIAADEVTFAELDDPTEARLERCRLFVDVVAVEHQALLEAERIARPEADRHEAPRRARPQ